MGKSTIIPGANYSTLKGAIKITNLPPYIINREKWLFAEKYNATTGVLTDNVGNDVIADPAIFSTVPADGNAALANPSQFGGKTAIFFRQNAPTSRTMKAVINITSSDWTMVFCFANQATAGLGLRRLLCFVGTDGSRLSFDPSNGATTPDASFGAMRIEVNGVNTILFGAATANKTVVAITYNGTTKDLKIYVNNVLDTTIPSITFTPMIGNMFMGSNSTGGSRAQNYFGGLTLYSELFDTTKLTAFYNFFVGAF